jgi:hypothetical protein
MSLNEKNLEALSAGLQIDKDILVKALTEDAELDLSSKVIYNKDDHETFLKNLRDQEYHKGKEAGFEMPLKEMKKKISESYGIETEGVKTFDDLFNKTITSYDAKLKETFKESANKDSEKILQQIEEKEKTINGLREKLQSSESEWTKKLTEQQSQFEEVQIKNDLIKIANAIPFNIPKEVINQGEEEKMKYIQTIKSNFLNLFSNSFTFEKDNGNLVVKKDGEIIKDNFLQTEKIESIALNFAKTNYFNIEDNQIINRSSSQKYGSSFKGQTVDQFNDLMREKKIHPGSQEYLKMKSEWKKMQT